MKILDPLPSAPDWDYPWKAMFWDQCQILVYKLRLDATRATEMAEARVRFFALTEEVQQAPIARAGDGAY